MGLQLCLLPAITDGVALLLTFVQVLSVTAWDLLAGCHLDKQLLQFMCGIYFAQVGCTRWALVVEFARRPLLSLAEAKFY